MAKPRIATTDWRSTHPKKLFACLDGFLASGGRDTGILPMIPHGLEAHAND
jgi:hypothetical protein